MQNNKTRAIVEGAIINGLYLIILMLALYTPLSFILVFVLPVPFIIYAKRNDLKSIIITALAVFILSFLIGNLFFLSVSIFMVLPGIIMGIAYRKGVSAWTVIARGTFSYLLVYILYLAIANYLFHMNLPNMILNMMDEGNKLVQSNMDAILKSLPSEQNTPEYKQQWENVKQDINTTVVQVKEIFIILMPSLLITSSFMLAFVSHIISRRVFKRLGTSVQGLPKFQDLHLPRWILYYYFIAFFILLFPDIKNYLFLYNVAMNGSYLLGIVLLVLGISVITKYWIIRGWNRGIFTVLVLILLFFTPFTQIFLYIGIIELLFNLRNRFSEK